jgi:hypothetical protein
MKFRRIIMMPLGSFIMGEKYHPIPEKKEEDKKPYQSEKKSEPEDDKLEHYMDELNEIHRPC